MISRGSLLRFIPRQGSGSSDGVVAALAAGRAGPEVIAEASTYYLSVKGQIGDYRFDLWGDLSVEAIDHWAPSQDADLDGFGAKDLLDRFHRCFRWLGRGGFESGSDQLVSTADSGSSVSGVAAGDDGSAPFAVAALSATWSSLSTLAMSSAHSSAGGLVVRSDALATSTLEVAPLRLRYSRSTRWRSAPRVSPRRPLLEVVLVE